MQQEVQEPEDLTEVKIFLTFQIAGGIGLLAVLLTAVLSATTTTRWSAYPAPPSSPDTRLPTGSPSRVLSGQSTGAWTSVSIEATPSTPSRLSILR